MRHFIGFRKGYHCYIKMFHQMPGNSKSVTTIISFTSYYHYFF